DVGNAVASTSGRMGQGIFANAASRGFTIEVGELQRAGTIYDREHLEFLRNEYNREVLGREVLTSEELIARIHQAQKDFDDFTGLSTIVTLPGGGMVMKGGLKLAARVLKLSRAAKGSGTAFRYVTQGEIQATRSTGLLRGGRAGETYFTKDLYKSGVKAQQRLSLGGTPTHRLEFQILNKPNLLRNGTKVTPIPGQPGLGSEFMTIDPVRIRLINVQPLR
ncbi:MAG: hypothetical protein AAGI25_02725, partial [Bacteroidota bacterium]